MKEMTTKQMLARLKVLVGRVGPDLYERVVLVCKIHKDEEWTKDVGGIKNAESILMDDFFPDLKPFVSFLTWIKLYAKFPNESDWKKRKYKLSRMQADLSAGESGDFGPVNAPPKPGPAKPRNFLGVQTEAVADELPACASAEDEVVYLRRKLEETNAELSMMQQANRALKRQVRELKRELEERRREAA